MAASGPEQGSSWKLRRIYFSRRDADFGELSSSLSLDSAELAEVRAEGSRAENTDIFSTSDFTDYTD